MKTQDYNQLLNITQRVINSKALNRVRSTITTKPTQEQILRSLEKANSNKLTESARMQFPKTENF